MPQIQSIVETALYVAELDRSQKFCEQVLGLREILREEGRLHALAIAPGQVLLLFCAGASTKASQAPGGLIPPHDGAGNLHVAFGIALDEVMQWRVHLEEHGIQIESEVDTPRGGKSLYFRDPDGHLVELVTPGTWSIY